MHWQVVVTLTQSLTAVVQVPAPQPKVDVAQSPEKRARGGGSAIVGLWVPMRSPRARKTNPRDPNPNDPAETMKRFVRDDLLCRNPRTERPTGDVPSGVSSELPRGPDTADDSQRNLRLFRVVGIKNEQLGEHPRSVRKSDRNRHFKRFSCIEAYWITLLVNACA